VDVIGEDVVVVGIGEEVVAEMYENERFKILIKQKDLKRIYVNSV